MGDFRQERAAARKNFPLDPVCFAATCLTMAILNCPFPASMPVPSSVFLPFTQSLSTGSSSCKPLSKDLCTSPTMPGWHSTPAPFAKSDGYWRCSNLDFRISSRRPVSPTCYSVAVVAVDGDLLLDAVGDAGGACGKVGVGVALLHQVGEGLGVAGGKLGALVVFLHGVHGD
jgi:hypothetical protein